MLELNKWFFVLLVNFLVLVYVLNIILFKPLLKVFKERTDTVRDALDAAKNMQERRQQVEEEIKKGLSEAALKARETFEALRAEGLQKQQEILSAANKEASAIAEKAREELRAEAEKARQALRADVERFSEEIVKKLVGV
jgi:F-type H+-transporting ATPase subunit b